MSRVSRSVLVLLMVVPATAGAAMTRSPVALTASPAHLTLTGSGAATIRVTNTGSSRVVVDVRRAGFSLDLRGRPKIVPRGAKRSADSWLGIRPQRFALRAGRSSSVTVSARTPRHAEPGDHDALVLLTTRPRRRVGLAVRMRLGVVVDVRAPGRVVRRLVLRELRVRHRGRLRTLELVVANRGNVTEEVGRDRALVSLRRHGTVLASLRPEARELLPHTLGLVLFRYRGPTKGRVSALVTLASDSGDAVTYRTFRIRL